MNVQWWQILIFFGVGTLGAMMSVLLGGWLVFRAKTITMPAAFLNPVSSKRTKSSNYLPGSLNEYQDMDDELSPAASRLAAQKAAAPRDDMNRVMAFVRGNK
jgi:hypothetical protein